MIHRLPAFLALLTLALPVAAEQSGKTTSISSLAELAQAAQQSGQHVQMKAGLYRLSDFIPLASIPARKKSKQWQFITFSGHDNVFDLSGVTIELDTALRQKLGSPIHTDEFLINGHNVTVKGLTITSIGKGIAFGGAVLGVTGQGATLRDCTIHVEGSSPYGYGDLFGKGGHKHSGVHVTGSGARFIGCKVFQKAFGHGFYLQENCNDVLFENCSVEGVMRRTDDMLEETSGLAFERGFNGETVNRSGTKRIQPGYMKALSEDGFRTYHTHQNVRLKNCTVKNMRGGFELRTKTAPQLDQCTAIGCERGFWVSDGAVLTRCKADAQFGPILYVEGSRAKVEVQLLSTEAQQVQVQVQVHAAAAIYGKDNEVTLTGGRKHPLPVLLGFTPPAMGENASIHNERAARGVTLRNQTLMPVVIGAKAEQCKIYTQGPTQQNLGKKNEVTPLEP